MGILQVQNLAKTFDGLKAVDDVSFDIQQGSITALIGPNGSGKTTVFNLVTGFLRPDHGEFAFKGNRITRSEPHKIARMGIGRTFQTIRLRTPLTGREKEVLSV